MIYDRNIIINLRDVSDILANIYDKLADVAGSSAVSPTGLGLGVLVTVLSSLSLSLAKTLPFFFFSWFFKRKFLGFPTISKGP